MADLPTLDPNARWYPRVVRAALDEPWAILPGKLEAIAAFVAHVSQGGRYTPEELAVVTGGRVAQSASAASAPVLLEATSPAAAAPGEPQAAARPAVQNEAGGMIAVVPIQGVIRQRVGGLEATSGMVSTEVLGRQLAALRSDERIGAIVLNIDSPGGGVFGVEELATEIFEHRSEKPIVAVANSLMASAAYWIGAAADELVVTPGGEVGSVGVFAVHTDQSGQDEMRGLVTTYISAGQFKTEGNPHEPLSDCARAAVQQRIDEVYGSFTAAVARFRGVPASQVRGSEFAEGRVVGARQAVDRGMADRVGTLRSVLERLGAGDDARPGTSTNPPPSEAATSDQQPAAASDDPVVDVSEVVAAVGRRIEEANDG